VVARGRGQPGHVHLKGCALADEVSQDEERTHNFFEGAPV